MLVGLVVDGERGCAGLEMRDRSTRGVRQRDLEARPDGALERGSVRACDNPCKDECKRGACREQCA